MQVKPSTWKLPGSAVHGGQLGGASFQALQLQTSESSEKSFEVVDWWAL